MPCIQKYIFQRKDQNPRMAIDSIFIQVLCIFNYLSVRGKFIKVKYLWVCLLLLSAAIPTFISTLLLYVQTEDILM